MGTIRTRDVELASGTMVRIRSAREEDAEELLDLTRAVIAERGFMVTAPDEFVMTIEAERNWIRRHANRAGYLAVVAEVEGTVVGLLDFQNGPRRRLEHRGRFGMSVRRDRRRLGIGRALLEALLDWAEAHPVVEKVSLAVLSTNTAAIAFYERMGFVAEGRRRREVKYSDGRYADDILMCRFVGGPEVPERPPSGPSRREDGAN